MGGEVVAETTRSRLLFETGLPTRYYIPKVDARLDLLVHSGYRHRMQTPWSSRGPIRTSPVKRR
ncbi:MAG TPA: DUF427 domain-containing protein [Actinomycetota bacterium]|nr:DUF427 domain-containing protein [Actinomycetota bacterium]